MTGPTCQSMLPFSAGKLTRVARSQFSTRLIGVAMLIIGVLGLLVLQLGITGNQTYAYVAYTLAPVVPLCIIASTYRSSRMYLFSTGFWLAVTVGFYLVLKAVAMIAGGDGFSIETPMLATCLFLVGYMLVSAYFGGPRETIAGNRRDIAVAPQGVQFIVAAILAFELMAYFLTRSSGAENTILKVAAATQNSGAAYLYRIPLLANSLYLLLLIPAYKSNKYILSAVICTIILIFGDIISSSRAAIIVLLLWNVYLYNFYIRPVKLFYIVAVSPILILIVVLFGYARGIGIGDFSVLWKSVEYLWANSNLIIQLFMDRLDMLPQMAKAFELDEVGRLPQLNGTSYVYAFLHSIPRGVWPDKPALTAAVLTQVTYPGPYSQGVLIYPSVIVEAVMNLGWAGLFVIGTVTGAMATAFDRAMVSRSTLPMAWAMTFFSFPMGLICEGFHSNFVANLIYLSMLLGISLIFLRVARVILPVLSRIASPI